MRRVGRLLSNFFLPLVGFLFLGSTVIGAIRNYSPVPFWDMWDGYIGFYERISNGHWEAWWERHMEHRLVFSRVFFWLDIKYFHGLSQLLIPLNLFLMGLLWAALLVGTRHLLKHLPQKSLVPTAAALLAIVCFSWMQKENIICGFQSAFFAACLFPMLAFQCLALSTSGSRSKLWFVGALAFGYFAGGTMANGIIALPLMAVMAAMQCQSKTRISILVVASILAIAIDHSGPGTFGSLSSSLGTNPIRFLEFLLIYLGGPFKVVFNDLFVAALAGFVFIVGCGLCLSTWLGRKITNPMFLAFLIFLGYIGITAVGTTSSRMIFGLPAAAPSRYMTPMLLAWAVLSILLASQFQKDPRFSGAALVISALVPLLLLPSQLDTIRTDPAVVIHQRMVAALALELGVNDKQAIRNIYPDDRIYRTASEAKQRRLSVFALPVLKNAQNYLHELADALPLHECHGYTDTIASLSGAVGISRVTGWAFDTKEERLPAEVFLVDSDNNVVGVGLTGRPRPDVARLVSQKARFAGFDGYVFGDTRNLRLLCAQ